MSESDLEHKIFQAAALTHRWRILHIRDSRKVLAGVKPEGFPDLVLVGGNNPVRTMFRELKTERGKLRPDQAQWRDLLLAAGADWAIWRPSDWPEIETLLNG